jgi:hypothetical protein
VVHVVAVELALVEETVRGHYIFFSVDHYGLI